MTLDVVPSSSLLQTDLQVSTPEGVYLSLAPAGVVVRGIAFAIDLGIRGAILLAAALMFSWAGSLGEGLLLLIYFALEWLYPVVFELFNRGQTPGKKLLGLTVVQQNGLPVGWSQSLIRNLLRAVDFLPAAYGFALLSMSCSCRFQRLGDRAAATLVVYQQPSTTSPSERWQDGDVLVPDLPIDRDAQLAMIQYAERCQHLNEARQIELADILTPISGLHGRPQVDKLHAWARHLVGR